jgi:NADH-quinone oxidoreductase subunit M
MILSAVTFLPVLGVAVVFLLPRRAEGLVKLTALVTSLVTFAVSIPLFTRFDASLSAYQFVEQRAWMPTLGVSYHLGVDGISLLLVLLTTFLMPLVLLSSWHSIERRWKEFAITMLLLETGMLGVFVALDLFLFYVFWEAMLVPMYLIIGIWGGPNRVYAAVKFILYTLAGSLLMLVAILALYFLNGTATGAYTFDLPVLARYVLPAGRAQNLMFLAFALAFAIKVPMWPFHTWLPDAHVEAPTAGSIILAGVLLKLGGYGFLRYSIPLLPNAAMSFAPVIIALAVIAILYGALVAMVQPDLKKLVAYSSVSHMGFVMLGAFVFNTQGLQGSVFQMVSHGITTGALFLLVGVIYERTHDREIAHMGGLNARLPRYAAIFGLFTFASIGLPGLSGFVGEFLVVLGAFQFNGYVAAATMLVVIASAVYMLWMFQRVFFTVPSDWARQRWPSLRDMSRSEWLALAPLIVLVVALGVYPAPVLHAISAPVERIIDAVHGAGLTSFSLPW